MSRIVTGTVALATVGALIAGCGTVVAGTAEPDPSAREIALNTGGLSTLPRKPTTSASQQRVLAANLLAERMPLPTDLDPTFTKIGALAVRAIVQSGNLKSLIGDADAERIGRRGLLYGFVSGRMAPGQNGNEGVTFVLLRMTDDAAARGAVDDIRGAGGAAEVVDGHTDWAVRKQAPGEYLKYTALTAYAAFGPILAVVAPWSMVEAAARAMVTRGVQAQSALLAGFTSPGGSELASLPTDKDSIVSYTVAPEPIESGKFQSDYGFRGRRAELHWDYDPADAAKVFEEAGMDLVGVGRNTVYRTRDAAGAQRLVADDIAWMQRQTNPVPFTVAGLPEAQCRTYTALDAGADTRRSTCSIAVGRYRSVYTDVQVELVRQVTAAGFLILRRAP